MNETATIEAQIQETFGTLRTLQARLETRKNLLNSRKADAETLRQVVSGLENEVAQLECDLTNSKSDLTKLEDKLLKIQILEIQNTLEDEVDPLIYRAAPAGSNAPHRLWGVTEVFGIIASYCDPRDLALVCKDWYCIARPLLWRHVRIKNSTDIAKCIKHRHWIVTIKSPFERWLLPLLPFLPKLCELVLYDVKVLGNALAALFDLNTIRVLKLDSSGKVDWRFYWGPSVDRVRARSFLHRLVSIDFGLGMPYQYGTAKMTIIEDVMHEGLRKIDFGGLFEFGSNLPIDYLSAAQNLTVICVSTNIPESFFRIVADHCPHLRAFRCLELSHSLVESFRYFMKQRGAQLVALQYSMTQGGIEELFEATMQECRSLEWFEPEDMWHRFHPDIFTRFLERCGRRLKYLAMDVAGCVEGGAERWVEDFFGTQLPILCPNMQRGWFRVGIRGDDGDRDGHVVYYGEGRWEKKAEKIMTHGYFDHTRYLEWIKGVSG
ncbi:hypothetical protein HK102_007427 [Quaeritorhiza haematococci]|nr:hypothetical protein HK102_007427 [Quaeritorhiza haematococci]